jgi:hypothetical protein
MEKNPTTPRMIRQQSFVKEAKDDFEVLMDGSKTFWRDRVCLDILIVSHPGQKCIEVAAYNAVIGVEAPRIYISSEVLAAKINSNRMEFEEKLKEAQEEVDLRKRKTCNAADLKKQVYRELVVSYILLRLTVVKDIDLSKDLRVQLSCIRNQAVSNEDVNKDVICVMPEHLYPVKVTFAKVAR